MNEIREYKSKLKKEICEYMAGNISERNAAAVSVLLHTLRDVEKYEAAEATPMEYTEPGRLTRSDIDAWNAHMVNSDGTTHGHWTVEQTMAVAESMGVRFEHINVEEWNATMNMMYSDYYKAAEKFNCNSAEFFACLAKCFLFDLDGGAPAEKLAAYYRYIVKQ